MSYLKGVMVALVMAGGIESAGADLPPIAGKGTVDAPELLAWPVDVSVPREVDLSEPTANTVTDLHAYLSQCDLVVSTAGNYHMAFREAWAKYLGEHPEIKNAFYTTSPPIAYDQLKQGQMTIGNVRSTCRPGIVVAPARMMDRLQKDGLLEDAPRPLYASRGNVILVKKGNPKGIESIWDLGRADVRVVFPHPKFEKGSFENYAETLYEVAKQDAKAPQGSDADKLFAGVFSDTSGKFLTGSRIHHREVPWSIAYGRADAGIIMYQLARYAVANFPQQFDIVPLGGSVEDPRPVAGNKVGVHFIALVRGEWTKEQSRARQGFMDLLLSEEFTRVLKSHGLDRPASKTAAAVK